jgi:hypothetical protein
MGAVKEAGTSGQTCPEYIRAYQTFLDSYSDNQNFLESNPAN